jgi:PhnB protein
MSTEHVSPVPDHLHAVTPRLVVADGAAAIDFYRRAFEADALGEPFTGPDGEIIHAELRIGDSVLMLSEQDGDGPPAKAPTSMEGITTVILATYWEDVDAVWERALAAGAEVVYPLEDQFYGERGGRVRDPFGHQWMLSQRTEILTSEEIGRRAADYFSA